MSRPTYSVSVSKIDSFHKFIHRANEDNEAWNNEANFLATLRGEFKQLESAKYGECFHAIIEGTAKHGNFEINGSGDVTDGYLWKGILIPEAQAQHAIAYREAHTLGVPEVPVIKKYWTKDFDLIVTGKVDRLIGNWIRDTKTKYSSPDIQEDYIDSMQWRLYLEMLGLDTFWYDIFQVSGYKEASDCLKAKIKPLEPLMLKRYPDMPQDCQSAVQELADYLTFKNLLHLVEISIIDPKAKEFGLYQDLTWCDSTVLNFGKHRNKTLAEVPQYLQWLYANKPLPAGLKEYIKGKGLVG